MYSSDFLQDEASFHAELIALNEKKYLSEIVLEDPLIDNANRGSQQINPFWITDYPILCYVSR